MEKYLFLDIDGVLNHIGGPVKSLTVDLRYRIDPTHVKILNSLIKEIKCHIILSSSWRKRPGLRETQIKLTKSGARFVLEGITPTPWDYRGNQIQEYMTTNNISENQIVIFDDDSDMKHLISRLVKTSCEIGLQKEHIDKARELWNNVIK